MRYFISSLVLAAVVHTSVEARANSEIQPGQGMDAPRATVVEIMNDAAQVLLRDTNRGEYVVVRVGDTFQQFRVTSIDAEQVVLSDQTGSRHFVLPRTADDRRRRRRGRRPASSERGSVSVSSGAASSRAGELIDPYPVRTLSAAGINELGVLDPYGESGPIKSVVAPAGARASATPTPAPSAAPAQSAAPAAPAQSAAPAAPAQSAAPAAPAQSAASSSPVSSWIIAPGISPGADSAPAAPAAAPAAAAPAAPAAAPAPRAGQERHSVSRRDFDAAVTDFHRLSKEVQLSLVDDGVRIDDIARGSLFHRWGLRAGDVVLSVDDRRIRGVDDAAFVYAHLMDADQFVVKVKRGSDTVVLTYRFTR